jgi:S1-C subfamily serine protease
MVCTRCGKETPEESTFCLHCGKPPQHKEPRVFSTQTLVWAIALTALIVALAGGVTYRLSIGRAPSTASATATPQANAGDAGYQVAKPSAAVTSPRELTSEELFSQAAPSVVLIELSDETGEKHKTGSGFVIDNGTIATNYHVIRGAYNGDVRFSDGSMATISGVLGHDLEKDVAILRVDSNTAKPLTLGDSDQLQVGNRVMTIGSPKGLQNTISDGLVSGNRNGLIQTSTPISPGSSGGPFFNTRGEVVGIAVSGILNAENLNFVVPINWVKKYLHSGTLTTLSDLSRGNTVVRELVNSTISVPARQRVSWPLEIDRNHMTSPELQGSFSSTGGMGGNIRVVVASQQGGLVYDSGRTTSGTVHMPLTAGRYVVVVDNTESMMFPRSVTADFSLKYVK